MIKTYFVLYMFTPPGALYTLVLSALTALDGVRISLATPYFRAAAAVARRGEQQVQRQRKTVCRRGYPKIRRRYSYTIQRL